MGFAHRKGIPTDVPWQALTEADRHWVIEGDGEWDEGVWFGLRRFFAWLEARSYKMHVRVLLSRYRSYDLCPSCQGARLNDQALDWRIGDQALADRTLAPERRFRHARARMPDAVWRDLPGLGLHDLIGLPIARGHAFFQGLTLDGQMDQAMDLLLTEIRARLAYLCEVGLGYLTLDRQSRTLSGGEVQRINLTTALGTSLVNTLFVLDEPSIGLHPRDMDRVVQVLHRLRDRGNSLVVVEHDPQVMLAADRVIDIGPGPGEHGGHIVFQGRPRELLRAPDSLTGGYLAGRLQVAPPRPPSPPADPSRWLHIRGASANNLKGLDVAIPLDRLVVVTGVSGSGKSTLVADVLHKALCQLKGHPEETPGAHAAIEGHDADRGRAAGRSVQHRPQLALQSGELCRRLRCHPQALRPVPAGQRARLHRRDLQLQQRQRALPELRRQRLRAPGDAVPGRCLSALPGLQRAALSRQHPGGPHHRPRERRGQPQPERRPLDRRGAGDDRDRGAGLLRRRPGSAPRPGAAARGRARLSAARPAGADALRRRGAAAQARRSSGQVGAAQGARRRSALPARRADHRAALRRHRRAPDRAAPPDRPGALAAGDRAQPGRDRAPPTG